MSATPSRSRTPSTPPPAAGLSSPVASRAPAGTASPVAAAAAPSLAASPVRADDAAIRSLAAAIHRELREGLEPEDVVRLASALLARVADELRERRSDRG